jgi:hypothetical protein
MQIEFSAKDKPQEWLNTLAQQFGTEVADNAFKISSSLGNGFMKQVYFFDCVFHSIRSLIPLH